MAGRGYPKGFLTKKMPQNARRQTPWIQVLAPGLFPGIWEKAKSEDTDGPESPEDAVIQEAAEAAIEKIMRSVMKGGVDSNDPDALKNALREIEDEF
jgi:hypothetical protein